MSRIRKHAAQRLGDLIASKVRFAAPPTVVSSPPSARTEYPACAIMIDTATLRLSTEDPVEVNSALRPGDPGYLIAGFYRTDDSGDIVDGDIYQLDDGRTVSHIGTIACRGRIWVGSRSGGQRERVEEDVWSLFFDDDAAPGRLLIDLSGFMLGDAPIPFGTAAATTTESTWNAEHAFDERLWSYLAYELDVPLLVARSAPLVTTMFLAITDDLATDVDSVADLPKLDDLTEVIVDGDGNTSPAP